MRHPRSERAAWIAALLTLAAVLLLLCAGGLALQHSGVDLTIPEGSHVLASVEALDSDETAPDGFEHLNALAMGLFLVSLGLLLGAGLVGGGAERRLLELLRLPPVIPLAPARSPLSVLEVFRI